MKYYQLSRLFIIFMLITNIIFILPVINNNNVKAAGSTYYVSTTGNNTWAGDLANPWKTIQNASDRIASGDTVIIRGGTYNERVWINKSGTDANWIIFQNYTNEIPIIEGSLTLGGGASTSGLLQIGESNNSGGNPVQYHHILISGLTVANSTGNDIKVGYSHNITIQNCHTIRAKYSGIRIDNSCNGGNSPNTSRDIKIINNTIQYARYDYPTTGGQETLTLCRTSYFELAYNTLDSTNTYLGIDTKAACFQGIIHHNNLRTGATCIYVDCYGDGRSNCHNLHNISIYDNYINSSNTASEGLGIQIGSETSDDIVKDITVYNNIVICDIAPCVKSGSNYDDASHSQNSTFDNISYINNIFISGSTKVINLQPLPIGKNNYYTNSTIKNNILKCTGTGIYNTSDQPIGTGYIIIDHNYFITTIGETSTSHLGSDYIRNASGQPWVSYSTGNFNLTYGAEPIDIGNNTDAPLLDYLGNSIKNGVKDIGAFEYVDRNWMIINTAITGSIYNVTITNLTTLPATGVEETTATLNGNVTGTYANSYGFQYGTTTGYGSWANSTDAVLYENYHTGGTSYRIITGGYWQSQTFKSATSHWIKEISIYGFRSGGCTSITARIETVSGGKPSGTILTSGTADCSAWIYTGDWFNIPINPYFLLTAGTQYCIVINLTGSGDIAWYEAVAVGSYADGTGVTSTNSGVDWTVLSTSDFYFGEYGTTPIFNEGIINLLEGTLYHFCVYATNNSGMTNGSDETFLTKPVTPTGLTVTSYSYNYINLSWTKGTGANNTVIRYSNTGYPATPSSNLSFYNGTDTYYNATIYAGTTWYFRGWSYSEYDSLHQYSDENASISLTDNPSPPTNLTYVFLNNNTINITWDKGVYGAEYTVLRASNTSQPILPTDGYTVYNGTGNYSIYNITKVFYITAFSLNTTGSILYSSGVNLTCYYFWINCYDEINGANITNFSVFITNHVGTEVYTHTNCNNTLIINTTILPTGEDCQVMINATGYYTRVYYIDINPNVVGYINAYLPKNDTAYLYYLRFVESIDYQSTSIDIPVDDVTVAVQQYENNSGTYTNLSILKTDDNGYLNLYLIPNTAYKVFYSKTGYISDLSDYIPAPANGFGQTAEKTFRITKEPTEQTLIWNTNITFSLEPMIFDQYANFTIYVNVSSSDSKLEYFTVNFMYKTNNSDSWQYIQNTTITNPNGGSINYTTNKSIGKYGVMIYIKKTGFNVVTLGVKYSDNKYLFNLWEIIASGGLDELLNNTLGNSPVHVGNIYATWTAIIAGIVSVFVLFTFSPRLAGLGVIATGIVLGAMKTPFNIISNAMNWGQISLIIVLGFLLMMVLRKKT